jgi:hypothetical protein
MVRAINTTAGRANGRFAGPILNCGATRYSAVKASITELHTLPDGGPSDVPKVGDAIMQIVNIGPQDDGSVHVRVLIDWPTPLYYRISLLIDP